MEINVEKLLAELQTAWSTAKDWQEAIEIKNKWFKKHITQLQSQLYDLDSEAKKQLGQQINMLKQQVETLFASLKTQYEKCDFQVLQFDPSLKNEQLYKNHAHWLNSVISLACEWFDKLNFQIEQGSEIVSTKENFDLLNVSVNHPSRSSSDSFYFNDQLMLRTQNTSNTAKVLLNNPDKQDLRVVTFGNVYRNDVDDATHSHQFMQIDFIWVQKKISLANLKWLIDHFLSHIFEQKLNTRYRPSYFPFTEPSFEVDVECPKCHQAGCNICKQMGWIEILGAGMIHQQVLLNTGYDPSQYSAIAAGIGCERLAMIKHTINDIRKFYNNDLRFFKKGSNLC